MLIFESFDKLSTLEERISNHEHYFIVVGSKEDALEVEKLFFKQLGYGRYQDRFPGNYSYKNPSDIVCIEVMTNRKEIGYRQSYKNYLTNEYSYLFFDWIKDKDIIYKANGLSLTPTYQPKKFIYESKYDNILDAIEKKESIFIKPLDNKSALKLNNIIKNKVGFKKLSDGLTESFLEKFDFNKSDVLLFFIFYNSPEPEYGFISVSNDIFRSSNIHDDLIYYPEEKNLINRLYNLMPDYEPKKFIYESNTKYQEYPYTYLIVKVNNEEELRELEDKINQLSIIHESSNPLRISNFPNYVFINPNYINNINKLSLVYLCAEPSDEKIKEHIYDDPNINDDILELSDWNKIKNILLYGYDKIPTYEPRKFIYESLKDKNLTIKCDNRADCVEFENFLHDNGWTYKSGAKYLIRDNRYINLTFYDFNDNDKIFTAGASGKEVDTHNYSKDKSEVNSLFKSRPTYQPKKFVYESKNDLLLESNKRYNDLENHIKQNHIFIMVNSEESAKNLNNYIKYVWKLKFHSQSSGPLDRIESWEFGPNINIIHGFEIKRDIHFPNPKKDNYSYTCKYINKSNLKSLLNQAAVYFYNYETEFNDIIKPILDEKFRVIPKYKPKKFVYESKENKVLYAFDMDDTLTYSKRFEEHVKPMLLREYLTPEIILHNKLDDIGVGLDKLKYENGRIYFDDPHNMYKVPKGSSWVRKKERIYIIQPNAFLMTDESMPIGTYDEIVDLYNKSEDKCIITARSERLRNQTVKALENLGIEKPNLGLFMYPNNSFAYTYEYKSNKLLELYQTLNYDEVHYYDDNIKILKKIKENLQGKNINIKYYKVTKNRYREL